MNKTIEELSDMELKAIGFETITELQRLQNQLTVIQTELIKRQQNTLTKKEP